MPANPLPIQISFFGSKTSQSGFQAIMDITCENREDKDWPYLSVVIKNQDGNQVYQSVKYAAWFTTRLCWDDADRFWVDSADTGIDVIASTPSGWRRHRWMPDLSTKTVIDVESGESLSIVNWEPPLPLQGIEKK